MSPSPTIGSSPNFIVLVADDMRWDAMGVAGNPIIRTPHLDALAADGVLFENNFTTTAICPTSRASISTGQYAHRHGIWDFRTPLSDEQFAATYYRLLRQAGYQTGFIGKWGLGGPLPASEFDYWNGFAGQGFYFGPMGEEAEHLTDVQGRQAKEFLSAIGDDRPFCLSISFKAPHGPFTPAKRFSHLYENATIPRPRTGSQEHFANLPSYLQESSNHLGWEKRISSDEDYQRTTRNYYRLVTGIDEVIGNLVADLKNSERYENTCIIFTSDHGFFLGEHQFIGKWIGFEEAIRTPLIIKPPGTTPAHRVHAMTLNVDIQPTVLELAGVPIPGQTQGKSCASLLAGASATTRDAWYYEHLFDRTGILKSEGVRTDRYKYLVFKDKNTLGEMFFDLLNDPLEESNLIGQAQHQPEIDQAKLLLERLKAELDSV